VLILPIKKNWATGKIILGRTDGKPEGLVLGLQEGDQYNLSLSQIGK